VAFCFFSGLVPWPGFQAFADDAERARELRGLDKVMPLSDILKKMGDDGKGVILDLDLEEEGGRVIYEIEIMDIQHKIRTLIIDARTGQVIGAEQD